MGSYGALNSKPSIQTLNPNPKAGIIKGCMGIYGTAAIFKLFIRSGAGPDIMGPGFKDFTYKLRDSV